MPFVDTPQLRIHFEERGAGPQPAVFIHGNIGSWRWWQPVMERLPERFHSYALDSRGCGQTGRPETGHSIAQFADDVRSFVKALGLSHLVLIGHSLGGGTAMQYAVKYPEDLAALILLDPLPAGGLVVPEAAHPLFDQWQKDRATLREALVGTAPAAKLDEFFEQLVDEAFGASRAVFKDNLKAMAEMNLTDALPGLRVPTLIIWGEQDAWIPRTAVEDIHRGISGSQLRIVPGVGHSLNVERPDQFVSTMVEFLDGLGAARAAASA